MRIWNSPNQDGKQIQTGPLPKFVGRSKVDNAKDYDKDDYIQLGCGNILTL